MSRKNDPKFLRAFDRAMFRSSVRSLLWSAIVERKKQQGFTFQSFAKKIGSTKHEVSRWFSGDPNWTLNTVASIASALDIDLRIEAVDRSTGRVFTSSGIKISPVSARQQPTRASEHHFVVDQPTAFRAEPGIRPLSYAAAA
jgi:transcriptional regulator with XRE-family HTH domain